MFIGDLVRLARTHRADIGMFVGRGIFREKQDGMRSIRRSTGRTLQKTSLR